MKKLKMNTVLVTDYVLQHGRLHWQLINGKVGTCISGISEDYPTLAIDYPPEYNNGYKDMVPYEATFEGDILYVNETTTLNELEVLVKSLVSEASSINIDFTKGFDFHEQVRFSITGLEDNFVIDKYLDKHLSKLNKENL